MGILTKHLYENPIAAARAAAAGQRAGRARGGDPEVPRRRSPSCATRSMARAAATTSRRSSPGSRRKAVVDHVARSSHGGPDGCRISARRGASPFGLGQPQTDGGIPGSRGKLPLLIGAGVLVALAGAGFALMPSGEVGGSSTRGEAGRRRSRAARTAAAPAPSPTPVAEAAAQPKPRRSRRRRPRSRSRASRVARSCIATAR